MKKILITGSTGFLGKNLIEMFSGTYDFLPYSRTTTDQKFSHMIKEAEGCIHLAGISRPQDPKEFYEGNTDLTRKIINKLMEQGKEIPFVFSSSIHAEMENDFGASKRMAEEAILSYGSTGAEVYIVRLTNTFGKWAKPNTHSVVATFCYNISHDLDIQISDPAKEMNLAYVDDVVEALIALLEHRPCPYLRELKPHYYELTKTYVRTLGELASAIHACKEGTIDQRDEFMLRINETYRSYAEMP